MAFDFKKEFKELYMPSTKPSLVAVPQMKYIVVRGKGNPNEPAGEYQQAVAMLYSVAYTLRMSYKSGYHIEGFFEYVVPPLEGFWWQEGIDGMDLANKDDFCWISAIRLPDFVTREDFEWAVQHATQKKKIECSKVDFVIIEEGLCVQILHIGAFDDEAQSVALMEEWTEKNGYKTDISATRLHHEIYLSDPRKTPTEKLRTIIRHPVRLK